MAKALTGSFWLGLPWHWISNREISRRSKADGGRKMTNEGHAGVCFPTNNNGGAIISAVKSVFEQSRCRSMAAKSHFAWLRHQRCHTAQSSEARRYLNLQDNLASLDLFLIRRTMKPSMEPAKSTSDSHRVFTEERNGSWQLGMAGRVLGSPLPALG